MLNLKKKVVLKFKFYFLMQTLNHFYPYKQNYFLLYIWYFLSNSKERSEGLFLKFPINHLSENTVRTDALNRFSEHNNHENLFWTILQLLEILLYFSNFWKVLNLSFFFLFWFLLSNSHAFDNTSRKFVFKKWEVERNINSVLYNFFQQMIGFSINFC